MRIGYACQTVGTGIEYRGCLQKNASPEALLAIIDHNLASLGEAVEYNIRLGIRLFRITSDLIPFGSSPVNPLPWHEIFAGRLAAIGGRIRQGGLRVSMHPGQYTVLNSPRPDVARRAAEDLAYHQRVLAGLGMDPGHKIILHVGGAYHDKNLAAGRFVAAWQGLPDDIRQRVAIENDDRSFAIGDVLAIGRQLRIPVIFDNLHHRLNPGPDPRPETEWIESCRGSWRGEDGPQKIHYSQQDPESRGGAHSRTIDARVFLDFCNRLENPDLDIMLEVKDKNLSAKKCILCAAPQVSFKELEEEWSRYKYAVLEHSPDDYLAIRHLLAARAGDPRLDFYDRIGQALTIPPAPGHAENAALHVWGYFKRLASGEEKQAFFDLVGRFRHNRMSIRPVKRLLCDLAGKYEQPYLAKSYYFYLP